MQADVLESIAVVAEDKLAKWELTLLTLLRHHLRDIAPTSLSGASGAPPRFFRPAIVQRVSQQLLKMARALGVEVAAATERPSDGAPVEWAPCASHAQNLSCGDARSCRHAAASQLGSSTGICSAPMSSRHS